MRTISRLFALLTVTALSAPAFGAPPARAIDLGRASAVTFSFDDPILLPAGIAAADVVVVATEERPRYTRTTVLLRGGRTISFVTRHSHPFAAAPSAGQDLMAALGK
jgi:hypothetical protein